MTRPELITSLDPASLDSRDRQVLSEAGFPFGAEDMAH
jgi:tRNA (guanine37-N1)-methyltransferase